MIDPTPVDGASPTLYASIVRAGGFPEASAAKMHPDRWGAVGVFKSGNGGATWTHLTNGLPALSATDLAIDPSNPDVLYAAIGHVFGTPLTGENGVYRTMDGGASWTKVSSSPFPSTEEQVGRIGIAIAPTDPDVLYAFVAKRARALGGDATSLKGWRTSNARAISPTWVEYGTASMGAQGSFNLAITAHPDDASIVYYGGTSALRWLSPSTPQTVRALHADYHAWA